MGHKQFDRDKLYIRKLEERINKVFIEKDHVPVGSVPGSIKDEEREIIRKCAERIFLARSEKRSVMLSFGAHTIKNGLAPTLIALMDEGWLTHLATNGAGIIHDWEFAYQGKSSEDVRENVREGKFGIWHETGFYLNLALVIGAWEGLGYGEAVGRMISRDGLDIPSVARLQEEASELVGTDHEKAAAAADLAGTIKKSGLKEGFLRIMHPYKKFSVQAAAWEKSIPFTGHPMIGHDIIYTHPMNHGAALGRCALRDFLTFTQSVSNLGNGIYISLGSAVMSPMIFEKALSMVQNIAIQDGSHLDNHYMLVVDLARSDWDWENSGEPPPDNPAYYLRYCKTFSRMGGKMQYLTADNRNFLLELHNKLIELK